MNILITGVAGFIGFHLSQKLLAAGFRVSGIDNLNTYYDVQLKHDRLALLKQNEAFSFYQVDLNQKDELAQVFKNDQITHVVNLAAQAGVRYSLINPDAYIQSNISGFLNILELCRHHHIQHLVFASSSSVYGANKLSPFSVEHNVDHPVSLYAATKKSNELMAHSYAHLFQVPVTGLRFFTVYGPYGRPDMALFIFTKAILEGKPINVFNYGKMKRDFTYVADIVEGIFRLLPKPPVADHAWDATNPTPARSHAPYQVFNIGNNKPVELMEFINTLEQCLGKEAEKNLLPMQDGDVPETYANIDALKAYVGFEPSTSIQFGIEQFVRWYVSYYNIDKSLLANTWQ